MSSDDGALPVAFYGTLRQGERAYIELGLESRLTALGTVRIRGKLLDLGAYPGLVEGDGEVTGELYDLPDPTILGELDFYELFDPANPETSEFIRRRVRLAEPDRDAWVYFHNPDGVSPLAQAPAHRVITSGDWKRRN